MPSVTFILPDETQHTFEALEGDSVMQVAVDNGIEQITADCGGCCSCATCHCVVEGEWLAKVGQADDNETALLESAVERQSNSRLSCQITLTDALDGLIVRVPESEW